MTAIIVCIKTLGWFHLMHIGQQTRKQLYVYAKYFSLIYFGKISAPKYHLNVSLILSFITLRNIVTKEYLHVRK